jgi:hypothetical protein
MVGEWFDTIDFFNKQGSINGILYLDTKSQYIDMLNRVKYIGPGSPASRFRMAKTWLAYYTDENICLLP